MGILMNLKSALIGSAAAAAMWVAAPAQAEYYVSVFGGASFMDADNLDVGPFSFSKLIASTDSTSSAFYAKFSDYAGSTFARGKSIDRYWENHTATYLNTVVNQFAEDEFDTGFVIGAAFGIELANGWRSELELAFRQNSIGEGRNVQYAHSLTKYITGQSSLVGLLLFYSSSSASKATATGSYTAGSPLTWNHTNITGVVSGGDVAAETSGDVSTFSIMANVWGDFDLGADNPITPFIGLGIGAANIAVDYAGEIALPANMLAASYSIGSTVTNTVNFDMSSNAWTYAWQAGAGLAFDLGGGRSLSAQYRYFATGDVEILGQDFGISSHEALIGLRIPLGR